MTDIKDLFERIDGYGEEIVRLERELCARVALGPDNGGTGEHEKTDYIKALFDHLNPDILMEINAPDQRAHNGYRPNLMARWDGRDGDPVVWVLSHSDVVPPGDPSLWDSDPFEVRVNGDRIVGRGVEDNQHGFISSYLALKAIMDTGAELKRPVGLVVVADEETGSEYGLSYVLRKQGASFRSRDLIIVPDAGNEDGTMIEVAEKSMLWLKFSVTGLQCHASTPHKGKNSLAGAARTIISLERLSERFDLSDPIFSPPLSTFAPTRSEENVPNINTIPGKNVFYLDCRILPAYPVDEVISASSEIAQSVSAETGIKVDVETVYRQDAAQPTPADAPVVKALAGAIKKVTSKQAKPMGIGGGTVAALFREAGLPTAVWSTCPDSAHQPNEYCLISDIITDAKVFATLYLGQYD